VKKKDILPNGIKPEKNLERLEEITLPLVSSKPHEKKKEKKTYFSN